MNQIAQIDIHLIRVRPEAQRELDVKRASKIADDWNPLLSGVIVLAENQDGTYECIDGQHRRHAAEIKGISHLTAEIHQNLDHRQRAELFLKLQTERKGVDKVTQFNVGVEAGIEQYVRVKKVLDNHGLKVGRTASTNTIATVSGLLWTQENGEEQTLDAVITAIKTAYGKAYGKDTWQADMFKGVARTIIANSHIDQTRLAKTIAKKTPQQWSALIAQENGLGGSGGRQSAAVRLIVKNYNSGLRTKAKISA